MPFGECPARDNVQVQVKYSLARAGAVIDDQAKGIGHAQLFGDPARRQHQVTQQCLVLLGGVYQAGNTPLGDDQDMYRRLGTDVVYGDAVLVLVEELTGDLAADNLAKNSIGHGNYPSFSSTVSTRASLSSITGMPSRTGYARPLALQTSSSFS